MATDSKVEAQLNETMDRLRRGAQPWKVRDQDLRKLKQHYRASFSLNASLWPKVRGKILRLAGYQGALAALLAECFYGKPQPPTRPVPSGCLWLASFVVQIGCPPQLTAQSVALGRHCTLIELAQIDARTVRDVGQKLLALAASSPLASLQRRARR